MGRRGISVENALYGKRSQKGWHAPMGKSAPTREEASASYQGKGTERRKEVEERRGGRSGTHGWAMRSTARMEKELDGRTKEESREVL